MSGSLSGLLPKAGGPQEVGQRLDQGLLVGGVQSDVGPEVFRPGPRESAHPQVMNTLRIADFSEVTPQKWVYFQMLWNSQMNVGRELTEADVTTMLHPYSLHIYKANFYSIQRGQVWRLFTPIFLHFNLLHILFNMMALIALGTAIEYRRGPWRFLLMVLIIAAGSNVTQFIVSGPNFGGMSGVVYGLFGYMWIKGKYDPSFGVRLTSETVTSMLLWLVLCMTGILGPIANSAHVAGLIIGIILAAISLPMKKQAVPETQV